MEKQKNIFLKTESNAWFIRNRSIIAKKKLPEDDPVLLEIIRLSNSNKLLRVLEIGCGDGYRLEWLKANMNFICSGLEPSAVAVEKGCQRGIDVRQGTADQLPFEDRSFDLVIFGFCLYLCDREDLFRIASEADRVLSGPGWLIIHDFYSPTPLLRDYHHYSGLFSYKMDYRALFLWHPSYVCFSHKVRNHEEFNCYIDDPQEWVALSVLRKLSLEFS